MTLSSTVVHRRPIILTCEDPCGHSLTARLCSFSLQACYTHCSEAGFEFMGLQFGYECYCGSMSDAQQDTQFGPGVCDASCMGDESATCGRCLRIKNRHDLSLRREAQTA